MRIASTIYNENHILAENAREKDLDKDFNTLIHADLASRVSQIAFPRT